MITTTPRKNIPGLGIFLGICLILIIVGLVFIYSSSSVYAFEKFGSSLYYVKRHIIGIIAGLIAFGFGLLLPVNLIKKIIPLGYLLSLGLTALTLLPSFSNRIHGSSRWLQLGGFSFQPSELLKVCTVLYIAQFIAQRLYAHESFVKGFLPILIILGLCAGVLLLQPDFGLTVTICITSIIIMCIAHYHMRYLGFTIISCIPIVLLLVIMRTYRLRRILTFLNPWADPQGAGFQIIQSLIAIGSGRWLGVGIGQSKQKFFYLPMQHTDFIFSIIAEETGFIGALFVISLFICLIFIGFKLASKMNDTFAFFATCGCLILINLQAVINIAVATGLAPTKGIGLPLVSYGNTSLVCTMGMIGFITQCALRSKKNSIV